MNSAARPGYVSFDGMETPKQIEKMMAVAFRPVKLMRQILDRPDTKVLAILVSAEANEWTTIAEIVGRTGETRRSIEEAVEDLRKAGEPIVAGPLGLRYSQDPTELAKYLEARRRRTATVHRGTMRMRTTLRRMRERAALTLWGDA